MVAHRGHKLLTRESLCQGAVPYRLYALTNAMHTRPKLRTCKSANILLCTGYNYFETCIYNTCPVYSADSVLQFLWAVRIGLDDIGLLWNYAWGFLGKNPFIHSRYARYWRVAVDFQIYSRRHFWRVCFRKGAEFVHRLELDILHLRSSAGTFMLAVDLL